MSVPKRDRKPSRMEFLVLCDEIRADTTHVLMNRRLVEPKWKYTVAVPGIQMTDTGAVVRLPMGRKTTRWRQKLKAMRRLYDAGKIPTGEDIRGSYVSTRATYTRRNARRVLLHMDGLFTQLFVLPGIARPLEGNQNGKCKKYHR